MRRIYSPGGNALRQYFYNGGATNVPTFEYSTWRAAWDTVLNPRTHDLSSTSFQVGGFYGATATNKENGIGSVGLPVETFMGMIRIGSGEGLVYRKK